MPIPRRLLTLLICGAALASCAAISAQSDTSASWLARSWQSDEGLPDNSITGVAQIAGGYLWLGTLGGPVSFDGARFRELPIVPIANVPNRVVRAIYADSSERLWLGMDRGAVVRLSSGSAQTFGVTNGLPDLMMSVMTEGATGELWIAYQNSEGLAQIAGDRVQYFREVDGAPANGAWWLAADRDRGAWFSKGGSIGLLNDGKTGVLFETGDPNTRIAPARGGGIWAFADGELFRGHAHVPALEPRGRPGARISSRATCLLEDHTGAVWIGTIGRGLFRFDGARFENILTSHRSITCLTEDTEGNIWAGTAGGGINRLRPRMVELLDLQSGLPYESIRSICQDQSGVIWMATQNGAVIRQEGDAWVTVSAQPGWPGGLASCVAADPNGGVWIGTEDRGLRHFQDGHFKSITPDKGLGSWFVRSLFVSANGDLWIGLDSPNKFQRLRKGKFHTLDVPPGTRFLRAMTQDAAGRLWVGTSEGQLHQVEHDKLLPEPNTAARPHSIRCLASTPDGSVWIGYAGIGLGRVKEGRLHRISLGNGLLDSYISQIVPDDQGWLWIGSNRGIFRVRLRELNDFFEGRIERVRSIAYGRGEGLPSLQASFDFFPGAFRGDDGRLWIPTRTGLAVIRPIEIRDDPKPPEVLIENVAVDARSAPPDDANPLALRPLPWTQFMANPSRQDAMRIKPDHYKIDFDFTALSFTAPDNVHFRYRLEGVDPDWVEAGGVRHASYSLLPARDYKFRVTACNHLGVWNPQGATLAFTVLPFFWQTWWFRASAVLAFSMLLVGAARVIFLRRARAQMRLLEQQAALDKERARIAKDIHDDLGASLTEIALITELAQHDATAHDRSGEYFDRIAGTARHVVKSLDEIVWAVNPRNDTVADFIDYTAQFALDYLSVAGIRCRLDLPEVAPKRELSADVRHNLFLASKESIHNIVKHSAASEAWLRVSTNNGGLHIQIEDNGRGFSTPPDSATADGLRNMRQRLKEIGGAFAVKSEPSAGCKVTIDLPWPEK